MNNNQRLFKMVMDRFPPEFHQLSAAQGMAMLRAIAECYPEGTDTEKMYQIALEHARKLQRDT